MTASVQELSIPRHQTPTWSEVECRTRFCQRCKKIPFDEGAFDGFGRMTAVSRSGEKNLVLYPDQLPHHDEHGYWNVRVDFDLVDNWPDLRVITKSSENCDFCKLIEARLRKMELPLGLRPAEIRVELFYCWRHEEPVALTGFKALVYGKPKDENRFTRLVWLVFTIDADEGECKRWLNIRQRPSSDFLCEENIAQITARLTELDYQRTSTFLPTRLIDLGYHDRPCTFGKLITREKACQQRYTSPKYVALSYPWGSSEQAARQSKTTTENIHERMAGIDLMSVSRVIQDAATVCKSLGIRYLWVDALCIIQGDMQDWERESTKMGNIFRNAYFTIGAAAIESCHESFLSQTDGLEIPFVSRIEPKAMDTYRLIPGTNLEGKNLCILGNDESDDSAGQWENRGWVFQEIAMATRLLVFGRTVVTLQTVEEGEDELPPWFNVLKYEVGHARWRDLVGSYCGKSLTFQKDMLPAISGLARFFKEQLKDHYLAGIWKSDLAISLFWHHSPPPNSGRQSFRASVNAIESRPYIAPSWSWAAENNLVDFGTYGFHPQQLEYHSTPECDVIDAQCTVEGLDPFGIVASGYIVLSAKVMRLEKGQFSITPTPGWDTGYYDWCLNGETRVMQTFLDGEAETNDPIIHRVVFLLLGSCEDFGIEAPGIFREGGAPNGERCAYGLVLYPAQEANSFYRVGVFNSQVRNHAPDGGLKFCDNWKTEEITII